MGEFLAVHMIERSKVGNRFTMWPLHMTLLPWFEAPDVAEVVDGLTSELQATEPFQVALGARDYLGRGHDVPVRLVQNTPQLQRLHEKLVQFVDHKGWTLKGRYTGEYYKPHVTQKAGRNAAGTLVIDAVYVAERQAQGYREIVGKVALG